MQDLRMSISAAAICRIYLLTVTSMSGRASLERSKVIMDYCAGNNIGIVTIDDRNYPEQLKNIYNPPVLLFLPAGDINCLQGKLAVSIVGTQKAVLAMR